MPSHMTGPPVKPEAAARSVEARMSRSWRWRPRLGGWSWAGGQKGWEGCSAKSWMSSPEEMEPQENKSPAGTQIK